MVKKELHGSMTVELSVIVSMIVVFLMGYIMTMFYYHDKNIIYGAAYETAVTGSINMRRKTPVTEEELIAFCKERMEGKCIFLTTQNVEILIQEEEIGVRISSVRRGYQVLAESRAPITMPEQKIRNIRRLDI